MRWTTEEVKYLQDNYSSDISVNKIASKIGKSRRSVLHKAARLGLSRSRVPHNKPKDKEYRKLVDKRYYEKNKKIIFTNKLKRLRRYKEELVDLLGGKCNNCGYKRCLGALEFHHISPNKERSVAVLIKNSSKQKALKETKKCLLLCANCHRELHQKQGSIVQR